MAVDKPGDYYNPPSDYQDMDGNWRTFTYVDHDKHTTRTKLGRETQETLDAKKKELEEIQESLRNFRDNQIKEILDLPAVDVSQGNDDFLNKVILEEILVRDSQPVGWNEKVLREACIVNPAFLTLLYRRVLTYYGLWYSDTDIINNPED